MREYKKTEALVLKRIICNGCGKVIPVKRGMAMEGVFQVRQVWGYMSEKDGEVDNFDLCEECYDRMTAEFQIPLKKTDLIEYI